MLQKLLNSLFLIYLLGLNDILGRYRRSKLGPFWITISMGVTIATIGFVFGSIFGTPMAEFLPYLASGLVIWNFLNASFTESCTAFMDRAGMIKQSTVNKNVCLFSDLEKLDNSRYNLLIIPFVFLVMQYPLSLEFIRGA